MRRPADQQILNAPFRRPQAAPAKRCCMAPGCTADAEHRAPMSRDRLNEYYWFCLEHVRAYNAAWDYFKGMNTRQIEAELRRDTTWHRPSWPLGGLGGKVYDPLGLLDGEVKAKPKPERAWTREEQALAVLELSAEASFDEIKARYRALVKRLHPDANGGDTAAEDRLKIVNQAYSTLKAAYAQVA